MMRDLSGLESVESRLGEGCNPLIGCAPLVLIAIWGFAVGARWYSVAGLALAAIGLVLLYYRLADRIVTTDSTGITTRSSITRRFIAWSDVDSATTVENNGSRVIVVKSTAGSQVVAPVDPHQPAQLEASIWQHLRRVGKADGIRLSDDALSLWCQIPESIPEEVELGIESQIEADYRYSLTNSHIAGCPADPYDESSTTPWSDVTDFVWERRNGDKEIWLSVWAGENVTLAALKKDDEQACRFFLAAVRKARTIPGLDAISIPEEYRALCVMPEQGTE